MIVVCTKMLFTYDPLSGIIDMVMPKMFCMIAWAQGANQKKIENTTIILITLIISPDLISINLVNLLCGNSGDKVNASKREQVI